jgi:anti-sigma factor RsiW
VKKEDDGRHFKEELQLLLDDRLAAPDRLEVEKHIEVCSSCRREFEILRWTKRVTTSRFSATEVPSQLEQEVISVLDREDGRSEPHSHLSGYLMGKTWKPLWGYGLAILIGVLLAVWFLSPPPTEIPSQISRAFVEYRGNRLQLDILASDVVEIERGFEAAGVPFPTRVFDLGMMDYQIVGGRVYELEDRPSAFFVYRNGTGDILVCQMFQGHVSELPVDQRSSLRENNDIQFYVYQSEGLTMVFWQEGDVICVLTSDLGSEEAIQLAFAKAIKVVDQP